jgi:ribose 5-phosphate isomerase A
MANLEHEKFLSAQAAAELVRDGMIVGLGTGSTAAHVVKILGDKQRQGLKFRAIPTSKKTRQLAIAEGIQLIGFEDTTRLDITIDGADEIDDAFQIVKGGGGALLHERIVASASDLFVVVGDSTKRVPVLGKFPLPVEVVPFAWAFVASRIEKLGAKPVLRRDKQGEPALTDEENFIIDCHFGRIEKPAELAATVRAMPGVVDQGLFINYPDVVILGVGEGVQRFDVKRTTPRLSP